MNYRIAQTVITDAVLWLWILGNGFKSGENAEDNRGFFFSIWEQTARCNKNPWFPDER